MVFTDIRLQNFRSYDDSSYELSAGVTIVIGPNAAGKTNLLESLMVAATGKTYRLKDNLVKNNKDWARIDVHSNENQLRTIKITKKTPNTTQEFEIDDKKFKRLPFSLKKPTVLFEPNHLFLLQGDPHGRRNYLDDLIEQLTPGYEKTRAEFKRVLGQRNKLLKQSKKDKNLVFALNVRFSQTAEKMVTDRLKLAEKLNINLEKIYRNIAGGKDNINLKYNSSINLNNYMDDLLKKLENNFEKDEARGFTGSGPHRDDITVEINNEAFAATGSRGETRTLLLGLKILELQLLEEELGQKPLLLLDDVFSELDGARRKALVNFLKNQQTIITTTDADIVTKSFSQKCQIIPLS
jgi:DNA replication and repair protein RecF